MEGDVLAVKYRVDRVLGQGGMGMVLAATHLQLGQRVALKFLLPEYAGNTEIVERFLREARAAAQLRSEHVCRVSDVGALETGAPYIVMELLEGRDLSSLLAERGTLPVPLLADYVVQACLGLAEAHAAGVVHRDLKPANLFLTFRPDGTPLIKLVDFGIAKAPSDTNFRLTQTSAVMGSPGYMSPEQLRSTRHVDARSDIWALGVILFELACGRPPFTATSITELALRVAMDPTPPLTGAGAVRGFDQVVYRCLEKDPARRFADVAQLAAALAPFGGPATRGRAQGVARVLSARPSTAPEPVAVAGHAATTTLGSSAASLERVPRARTRWGILLAALAAGSIATVAVVTLRRDEPHAPATGSSHESPASPPTARPAAVAAPSTSAAATIEAPPAVDAAPSRGAAGAAETAPSASAVPAQPSTPRQNAAATATPSRNAPTPDATATKPAPAPNTPQTSITPPLATKAPAPNTPQTSTTPPLNAPATKPAPPATKAAPPPNATDTSTTPPKPPATKAAPAATSPDASSPATPPARPSKPPPVRRVTKPAQPARTGSDDDVGNSRL